MSESQRKIPPERIPELVARYEAGETPGGLAREFGLSRERIFQILRPRTRVRRIQEVCAMKRAPRLAEAKELLEAGLSTRQAGPRVGLSHETIRRYLGGPRLYAYRELLTPAEWRIAYWEDPEEPSLAMLGERLGIAPSHILAALKHHGIPVRSRTEGVVAAHRHGRLRGRQKK